jgi:S-DNA-T family DNA segregation ATPase FtsK/SpoIIIE
MSKDRSVSVTSQQAAAESTHRRRLGALAALGLGLFLGLTLIPVPLTGQVGDFLRGGLWHALGIGALALPVLGIALALAGFDRLGSLDMKRAALLITGLGLLVPYLVGTLGRVTANDLNDSSSTLGHLVGWLPGFFAVYMPNYVGVAGAVILGFLALSAITLVTLAWHPLQRLERNAAAAPGVLPAAAADKADRKPRAAERLARAAAAVVTPVDDDDDVLAPVTATATRGRKEKKAKPASKDTAASITDEDELPPIELLSPAVAQDTDQSDAQLDRLGASLLETLRTFKVEGTIAGRTTGPVVTQFEVVPAPGVKAQRIVALADDLAMAMRAPSIRVAPIPGKGAVGVEVPNPKARMVTLRELLESPEWDGSRGMLPLVLGRDIEGKPIVADLAKMPHLLIAGATGTGKSVAINSLITSLVYRYTPRELRLLMVDPKMVELSMYNTLPHLRHKVVTHSHDAAAVLKWAVFEMNRRYELLQANGARNLSDFNRKVVDGKTLRYPLKARATITSIANEAPDTPPAPPEPDSYNEGVLPMIVLIIDELADLMMTVQGEVETPLALLAQKARAIGIHLILATQRPSVNVITGLIKANFPSRIAFRVASKVDSRTILDGNGAEALLGNGDMLFLPPGSSEPMRIQGAYIATDESERVMDWYVARREARRAKLADAAERPEDDILAVIRAQEADEAGPKDMGDEKRDALFREAAEVCIQNQGGSTSLLQRRMSIGYGRAARVIDQLHMAGILGPPDGSKPREVLIGFDQLDEYCR